MLLRIHGDNIIECERGLNLIADSFEAKTHSLPSSPYMPRYEIIANNNVLLKIELLPGHGRWGINIQDIFQSWGAPLRESTDIVLTEVIEAENKEKVILAIEFSSALPAGNNAWQRNGRALTCAVVGVPYLYFTEIGGVELDENRALKAPRFPNPIVPFSYLTTSETYQVLCLPVYMLSASSSASIYTQFSHTEGLTEAKQITKCIIQGKVFEQLYHALAEKTIAMVTILADARKRYDTLRDNEWRDFFGQGSQKIYWLIQQQHRWQKKRTNKVESTPTFQNLVELFNSIQPLTIGANDIPICLLPSHERLNLVPKLAALYGNAIDSQFLTWLAIPVPLIIVWITGFKPKGEDSRPDRGLVPLARMLGGPEIEVLVIVSGPAKPDMWLLLQQNREQLAQQNGLWESIIRLGNAILVDSPTLINRPLTCLLTPAHLANQFVISFPAASAITRFSEHDVDTIIHGLFSTQVSEGVFESMCNPPGGDWSGLSVMNFQTGEEFRWTSLPRVSGVGGKRPDHVIQFTHNETNILLAIESKDLPAKIPIQLGTDLITYVEKLTKTSPVIRKLPESHWQLWSNSQLPVMNFSYISGGAFCWTQESDLDLYLEKCQFDIIIAIEFDLVKQTVLLHLKTRARGEFLSSKIQYLTHRFNGWLEIQVH